MGWYIPLLILLVPGWLAAQNTTEPQYALPGGDYAQEYNAINDMFRNLAGDVQQLKGDVSTLDEEDVRNSTNTWTKANTFDAAVVTRASHTANGGLFNYYRGTQTWTSVMTNIADNCCACATNSTTTFVSDSGTTTITISGSVRSEQAGGERVGWSILIDGLNPAGNGLTCGGPLTQAGQQLFGTALGVGTVDLSIATSRKVTVAPGSHQFCLTLCSGSATGDTLAYAQPILEIAEAH